MVRFTIDDRPVETFEGCSILQAAREAGIFVPSLCYNAELTPIGACRLCVVEVKNNGSREMVTACTTPVSHGLEVFTRSENIDGARKLALQLILAQDPSSPEIHELTNKLDVEGLNRHLEHKECILCQLCVRTCREVVGAEAISFIARAPDRKDPAHVEFNQDKCIACASCAYICPTRAITAEDDMLKRKIKIPSGQMEFELKVCAACGNVFAPVKQIEFMIKTSGLEEGKFDLCLTCRP